MTQNTAITSARPASRPALEARAYSLAYETPGGLVQALKSIDISIPRGKTLGLVGESGSGKTSLAWAIMRYLPGNARELGGDLLLAGESLRATTKSQIADIRGARIGMVFQDPSTSLNPTLTLGEQLAETLIRHRKMSKAQAFSEGEALLARTGITRPAAMMKRYPHEASGGEKQRVVIATAFACDPECILFDEPTTALDTITSRQILDIFQRLQEDTGVAALYISHDLALVSRIAHDVAVIHRGEIVERGATATLFRNPQHDYTRALIAAAPRPDIRLSGPAPAATAPTVLATQDLTVRYGGRTLLQKLTGRGEAAVEGARNIDLDVREGEILGIVGESGSGKSTIARAIAGIADFNGTISFDDHIVRERGAIGRSYRRAAQIIFQNPDASLNPRQRVGEIIARPLKLYGLAKGSGIEARVAELLAQVRLPADFAGRYPHQLSGGEKQRVAIARAFAARPKLVICDEVTSSLDVSVQAAVARLLVDLQAESKASCLFITHDLNLVRQLAHRIAVVYRGDLVDLFEAADFDAQKRHPYTRALLEAMPPPIHP
ncbi:ABC transporter ATP-binding protein [Bosea sp. LjRoot9]|uniref:dipeptide ABC transporter ATP-binding protein n=1 Tax=Bosea sp. LjRoot9 TaxID=3342341 RepID=UPI003ECEA472